MTEIKDWNDLEKLPPSKTHYINVVHTDTGEDAYGYDSYWISPFNEIEIVGNVYDNGELLDG